jgi:CHAT domain-containing protein/tetratricopeptide (TPR) repeat protein
MISRPFHPATFQRLRVLPACCLLASLVFALPMREATDAPPSQPSPQSSDALPLEPGKPVERELKGGETHRYTINLAAGQYARFEVEQRGIDVLVAILPPGQERPHEFGVVEWMWGKESACVIAEQAGSYTLQVRPLYDYLNPGRYEVRIRELRAAAAADGDRVGVQKYFAEAYQLIYGTVDGLQQTSRESAQEAMTKLEAALQVCQKIGDRELEATIQDWAGSRYSDAVHDQPTAIRHLEQALRLRRSLGQRREEARALFGIGWAYTEIGRMQQARDCFQQSLAIFREIGERGSEGKTLYLLGETWVRESVKTGLDYYLKAEPLLHAAGDIEYEAEVLWSLGMTWLQLGEPQKAFEALGKAQPLVQRIHTADPRAVVLDNLSKVHHAVGDYQKALDAQYEALALRQSIGGVESSANSYLYLALVYLDLGETERAAEFLQQSVKLRQSIGYHFRALRSQCELGRAYYLLGQHKTALDYFQSILPLTREHNEKFAESRVLEGLGLTSQALGEHRKAVEFYEQALAVMRGLQWQAGESRVILASGQAHAVLGDLPKAFELYREALALARKLNQPYVEAEALSSIARAELKRGNLTEARAALDASLAIVESVRSRVASPALRASFLATQRNSYDSYLALLMRLHRQQPAAGHDAEALQLSERARARSLLETLAEAPANIRAGVDPALLSRERELRQRLSAKAASQDRAASRTADEAAEFSREIASLTAELEQVEARIRTASPRYAAITRPRPLKLSEIQQAVGGDDTLLLEYALGEEQSFLFAVTARTLKSYELPRRAVIESAARRYYELLTARNRAVKFEEPSQRAARVSRADAELTAAGVELSRLILKPAAAELGDRRLLIVADGALQMIPFAALPAPDQSGESAGKRPAAARLLLDRHVVSHLPSATVLAQLRRDVEGREPAPKMLAVFADPVFEPDDERLPRDVRDRLARERQAPLVAENRAAENRAATPPPLDDLTRAIRDVAAADERGGLARLPHTREEAAALVALAPPSESFAALDFDATEQAALSPALGQYRYVHFATHGLLDHAHPELSGLVLSRLDRHGRALDGHLRLVEIYDLKLPAELVVLSACKSGLGREVRGEGLLGLTRGFMQAGAARVAVSLWDVNDKSTAGLMKDFYRELLRQKLSPAAALRAAQMRMRQSPEWSSPYYWAAFVLHGEPR